MFLVIVSNTKTLICISKCEMWSGNLDLVKQSLDQHSVSQSLVGEQLETKTGPAFYELIECLWEQKQLNSLF